MKILVNPTYLESEQLRFDYFKQEINLYMDNEQAYLLLDVGCSQLDFSRSENNLEAFGIDLHASELYDAEHFRVCNLDREPIPFADGKFDIVVAGEVLEHVKRPFEFIEELSRVLSDEGLLILSTPNPHYYIEILKELFGSNRLDDPEHLNLFSRIHLTAYAEKSGLQLQRIRRYKSWVPFLKVMSVSLRTPRLLNYQNIYIFKKLVRSADHHR